MSASDTSATANSTGNSGGGTKSGQMSLTPRFTQEEKEILYDLFHQYEEIIDIKFRKKQRSKFTVRDSWEQIVQQFNAHPNIGAQRNLKQIQKFWLNARLRKQYPFRQSHAKNDNSSSDGGNNVQVVRQIKDEPDYSITAEEHSDQNESAEFEEIQMDSSNGQHMEEEQIEMPQQQQQQQIQHVQQQQTTTIQPQQISVDQISAEKLTLNDLLQFKTSRPRDEIILQIKHPNDTTGTQITLPSPPPVRIGIPTHHQPQQHAMATITANGYNQQIISEIKPQQITLAQYQAQQQQQQLQQQQLVQHQQLAQQQIVVAAQQAQPQQQQQPQTVKMQIQTQPGTAQFATATPTFTCTTYSAVPASGGTPTLTTAVPTQVQMQPLGAAQNANTSNAQETYEEKIHYFKMKEAELRFKEEQVVLEKKKIELVKAQEEMKHMKELHRLQLEELRTKIRILHEEEKLLRKNQSNVIQT